MKMIFFKIMMISLLLFCSAANAATQNNNSVSLMSESFPPYAYAKKGLILGSAVEIVKEVFLRMGKPFSLKVGVFGDPSKTIKENNIDALFCIPREIRFEFLLDFVDQPLFEREISFFCLAENNILFLEEASSLKGKKIAVVKNVYYGADIVEIIKEKQLTVKMVSDYGYAIDMLINKEVDIIPADTQVMLLLLKKLKKESLIKQVSSFSSVIKYYIGFNRDKDTAELKYKFDKFLSEVKASKKYDVLIQKGLGQF